MRLVLLLLMMMLGAWVAWSLRSIHLGEPLWLDERHTQWVIEAPWPEVAERAAIGNQPPLYFYLLKGFGCSAQTSAEALRALSLLSSFALVLGVPALIFFWTKSLSGSLVALAFFAIKNDLVFFATEARVYALLTVVALVQSLVLIWRMRLAGLGTLDRARWPLRIALIGLSIILVWLHYTALLLFVAQSIAVAVQVVIDPRWRTAAKLATTEAHGKRDWRRGTCIDLAIDASLIGLGILPLAANLFQVGSHRQAWQAFVQLSPEQIEPFAQLGYWGVLFPIIAVCVDRLLRRSQRATRVPTERKSANVSAATLDRASNESRSNVESVETGSEPVDGADGTLLDKGLEITSSQTPAHDRVFDTIGVASFMTGATLAAWGLALAATAWGETPVFLTRYLLATWSWLGLATGLWIATLSGAWIRPIIALVLALLLSISSDWQSWYRWGEWPVYRTEDWARATSRLNQEDTTALPVILFGGVIEEERLGSEADEELIAYLRFPLVGIDRPERVTPASLSRPIAETLKALDGSQLERGLVVVFRDHPFDRHFGQEPERKVLAGIEGRVYRPRVQREPYGTVGVLLIRGGTRVD